MLLIQPYILCNYLPAQSNNHELPNRILKAKLTNSSIILPDRFIISGSEIIKHKDTILDTSEYNINRLTGLLFIKNDKYNSDTLTIYYKYLPLDLNISYQKKGLHDYGDSVVISKSIEREKAVIQSTDDIFGGSINKSGSLIRSFSLGSNKDLTLNSGFRLQLSGEITEGVMVTASLTDETTPLLPEGNTQTIKEIDKIFINVNHKNFDVVLGDFVFENKSDFFGNITRKLAGGMLNLKTDEFDFGIAYGSPPGKFTVNEFLAADGVQGPYRLTSSEGSPNILIIPNSEKVYLNGIALKRGELEDYTVDYSTSEITFTIKNLLTKNSRIMVEFEYSDQQYERSFVSVTSNGKFFNEKLHSNILLMQEGDLEDSPVDFVMNDENRKILESAGNDKLKASRESITFVGIDSITGKGLGQYSIRDTVISGNNIKYYLYNPGSVDAVFSIRFSYIGEGKGSYIRESFLVHKWVGEGKGDYQPINLLPMPERKRFASWNLFYQPDSALVISNELALSNYEVNKLSLLDEGGISGIGIDTKIKYKIATPEMFNWGKGKMSIALRNYYVSDKFKTPNKYNEIDYYHAWNINDSLDAKKNIFTLAFDYDPSKILSLGYQFSNNNYGFDSRAQRNIINFALTDEIYPQFKLSVTDIRNREPGFESSFSNQTYETFYRVQGIKINGRLLNESKEVFDKEKANLITGYEIKAFTGGIGHSFGRKSEIGYEMEYREDFSPIDSQLRKESSRIINKLNINYSELNDIFIQLNGGFQKKNINPDFKLLNKGNDMSLFVKSLLRYSNSKRSIESNVFYETSSQYSAKTQKLYLRVEKGKGSHIYVGDINKNNVADESEFQQVKYDGDYIPVSVKTDELIPVTDLKTSFRLKLTPSREINRADSFFESLISNISTETNLQVNETNKTSNSSDIFILKLSKFMNDSLTLKGGNLFTQDLYLLEKSKFVNIRYRYNARNSISQYTYGIEKKNSIERSLRFRFYFMNEITNETVLLSSNDNSISLGSMDRNYNLSNREISTTFSYRPITELEISFNLLSGTREDFRQSVSAGINSQTLGFNYSLMEKGNFVINFERNEMLIKPEPEFIPYNLTDGKNTGISWLINSNFSYNFNSFTTCSFSYLGRKSQKNFLHNMNLEVRLIF